jgi:iron complex outermembrane receptor protein
MSELMNTQNTKRGFRGHLLVTVSALAFFISVDTQNTKAADQDGDQPTVWIELGGELVHTTGQGDNFPIGFLAANPNSVVLKPVSPFQAENPLPFSFAEQGKISFQPEGSDWVFSGAANYGRSSNFKHVDYQTNGVHKGYVSGIINQSYTTANFADTQVHHQESHSILDFSVGKDVGLGLFGREASSTFGLGARFAQFSGKTTLDVRARPDLHAHYVTFGAIKVPLKYFHTYHVTGHAARNFHGIGPSLSWIGTAPVIGNLQTSELTFDWGVNAALLFGRQMAQVRHHESGHYVKFGNINSSSYELVYQHSGGHDTARSITVPNVGGFAGVSWRVQNFKVSFGYRADFFFGAIDGGIDTRKSETLGFYGPFASISIGIGG